jgi:ubiquinone/menaquinone biosynthesis C-methylase UbiE
VGTEAHIRDRDVLDIGCGPNLDFPHLENHRQLARSYVGLDASAEFVLSARMRHPEPNFAFAQAFASRIPLADKSVDTTLLSFVIHHIETEFDRVMDEVLRVTRGTVIIFDHLKSTNPVLGGIQQLYWDLADGGCAYQTQPEWERYLSGVRVERRVRTGAIFGHVVKYICTVPA